MKHTERKYQRFLLLFICLLIVSVILSFIFGRYSKVSSSDVIYLALNKIFMTSFQVDETAELVISELRFPRIIGACMIGASLALSGTAYQALFGNPIASPDTLGVSNSSSFAAVLGIILGASGLTTKILSFIVGTVTVLLVFFLANKLSKGKNLTTYLLLIGMVVSALFSALLSILKYVADPDDKLPQITYWLMGSLSKITNDDIKIYGIIFLVGSIPLIFLRWRLNILSLSDSEIRSIGQNAIVLRIAVVICSTLLTASATSITGGISWVGLIIPHVVRRIVGTDFRYVVPLSCTLGALFLLIMDDIARSISVNELPISILTSLVGAPLFFIVLMLNKGRFDNEN